MVTRNVHLYFKTNFMATKMLKRIGNEGNKSATFYGSRSTDSEEVIGDR